MNSFYFIVDCSEQSGKGHLSRCLVLAKALRKIGANCEFFVTSEFGIKAISGFTARPLSELTIMAETTLIVDGYDFSTAQLTGWQDQANALVIIDDLAESPFPADMIINHNLYGDQLDYSAYGVNKVLAGPQFAMIKPEFAALREISPKKKPHILVNFGGSKLGALGLDVAQALAEHCQNSIDVVMPAFALPNGYRQTKQIKVHISADIVALMGRANIFVGALGVSYLEALAAGRKTVGVQIANNQRLAFSAAQALNLSVIEKFDVNTIVKITTNSLHMNAPIELVQIDGNGASRVAKKLVKLN